LEPDDTHPMIPCKILTMGSNFRVSRSVAPGGGRGPELGLGDVGGGGGGRGGGVAAGNRGEDRAVAAVAGLLDGVEVGAWFEDPVVAATAR